MTATLTESLKHGGSKVIRKADSLSENMKFGYIVLSLTLLMPCTDFKQFKWLSILKSLMSTFDGHFCQPGTIKSWF